MAWQPLLYQNNYEIESLTEAGVFLSLFAIGLEFSPRELGRLRQEW